MAKRWEVNMHDDYLERITCRISGDKFRRHSASSSIPQSARCYRLYRGIHCQAGGEHARKSSSPSLHSASRAGFPEFELSRGTAKSTRCVDVGIGHDGLIGISFYLKLCPRHVMEGVRQTSTPKRSARPPASTEVRSINRALSSSSSSETGLERGLRRE